MTPIKMGFNNNPNRKKGAKSPLPVKKETKMITPEEQINPLLPDDNTTDHIDSVVSGRVDPGLPEL